jgi:hypothetical protein
MTSQDILENNLTVFECHTDDPHQKIQVNQQPGSMWWEVDVADINNNLDFENPDDYFRLDYMSEMVRFNQIEPDDFFIEESDPAGGTGLQSRI